MDKSYFVMDYPIMAIDPSSAHVLRSYHHIPDSTRSRGFSFLSRAGHFRAGPRYRNQRASVPGHELFLCLRGRGFVRQAGRRETVSAGQLVWIDVSHPHVHWADPDDPWEVYWLRAEGVQLDAAYRILASRGRLLIDPADAAETAAVFERIFTLFEQRRQPFDALANAEIAHLIAICVGGAQPSMPEARGATSEIADMLEEMRIYYQRTWRVGDIARRCGKSPAQTHRLFQKAIGSSPVAWLRRIRIEQAMQKLVGTEDSVAEIAYQVGYNDPLFFSRDFRKAIGRSPSEYRKHERK